MVGFGILTVQDVLESGHPGLVILGLVLLGYCLILLTLSVLGCLKLYRLQALLANVCIVAPSNVLWSVSYVVLTPFRWLWIRLMNMMVTRVVSLFTVKPSFKEATFEKLLKAFPIGYGGILFENIMEITEEEARVSMRKRITEFPFPLMRKEVNKCCTNNLLNSFVFRLVIATTIFPLLGWWLIGFTYVPFVPVFCRDAKPSRDDSIGEDKGSSVCLEIPSCTFLSRARKVYDDDAKGNRACINE